MHFLHIMEIRHESNCCRGTGSRERAIETGPCFKRRLPAKTTTPHLSTTNHHMQFCVTAQKLQKGDFFFCFSSSSFSLQHCSGFNWLSTDFHDKKKKNSYSSSLGQTETVRTTFSYTPSNQCTTTVLRLRLGWVTWGKAINQLSF